MRRARRLAAEEPALGQRARGPHWQPPVPVPAPSMVISVYLFASRAARRPYCLPAAGRADGGLAVTALARAARPGSAGPAAQPPPLGRRRIRRGPGVLDNLAGYGGALAEPRRA